MKKYITIKHLLLIFCSVLLALVIAEGLFRIIPPLKHKYSSELFTTKFSPLQWLNDSETSYKFRHSDLLGHERIPDSAPNINSYGLIGEDFKLEKDRNEFRILVLGDSIVAQNYFVKFLEKKLNELSISKEFRVINAGVGSYQLWHYARFLKYKGIKYNPDMVFLSFSLDDARTDKYTCFRTEDGFEIYSICAPNVFNKRLFNIHLFRHSYVYRVFIIALEKIFIDDKGVGIKKEALENLNIIKNVCNRRNIPILGFIWPALIYYSDYSKWEKKQYRVLTEGLQKSGINYINLSKYFPEDKRGNLRKWPQDYVHPSKEGHRIATDVIFDYIIKNYKDILSH